jgi:hypothetical protein
MRLVTVESRRQSYSSKSRKEAVPFLVVELTHRDSVEILARLRQSSNFISFLPSFMTTKSTIMLLEDSSARFGPC